MTSIFFLSYGSGKRIKLAHTRKIIDAIHSGSLLKANYKKTQVFGLEIPTEVEGVPSEILDPVNTVSWPFLTSFHYCLVLIFNFLLLMYLSFGLQWTDKKAYDETLLKLAGLFKKNFEVFANYKIGKDNKLTEEIVAAGPIF